MSEPYLGDRGQPLRLPPDQTGEIKPENGKEALLTVYSYEHHIKQSAEAKLALGCF